MEFEPLTEGECKRIAEILSDPTFIKVSDSILEKMDGPIYDLKAPEQLTALAITKGGREFLRLLRRRSIPIQMAQAPIRPPKIKH